MDSLILKNGSTLFIECNFITLYFDTKLLNIILLYYIIY